MKTIEQRVAAGAAWLDETRPTWVDEVDLDLLDLGSTCNCVLGQFVTSEANRYDAYYIEFGYDTFDLADMGFDAVVTTDPDWIEEVLRPIDSLADLAMTIEQAGAMGFHVAWLPDMHSNKITEQYGDLTTEWKRVILQRRTVQSGKRGDGGT